MRYPVARVQSVIMRYDSSLAKRYGALRAYIVVCKDAYALGANGACADSLGARVRGGGGHQDDGGDDGGDGLRSRRQREQTSDALRVVTGARVSDHSLCFAVKQGC